MTKMRILKLVEVIVLLVHFQRILGLFNFYQNESIINILYFEEGYYPKMHVIWKALLETFWTMCIIYFNVTSFNLFVHIAILKIERNQQISQMNKSQKFYLWDFVGKNRLHTSKYKFIYSIIFVLKIFVQFTFMHRSGKSSILKVVFHKMSPNETLFLESTNKIVKDDISNSSFVQFRVSCYNVS